MSAIGINVSADGRHDAASLRAIGATWARIVARRHIDISGTLSSYRAAGINVLLVLDRMSIEEYGLVDSANLAASTTVAVSDYLRRYGQYVSAVQPGNEPDHTSPSSWTLSLADFTTLGRTARQALPGRLVVSGGLVSGQPSYLSGADLSWCDAVAIHPYLRDAPNPTDLEDIPDVDVLVRDYAAFGKQLWITEWGWWGTDEQRGAEEVRDMIGWAASNRDVGVFCYFAMDDAMVWPFGLYRADGTPKPAAERFRSQAAGAVLVALPAPGGATVPPPLVPIPSEDAALSEAWRALWQAVVPDLDYHADWAIPTFWREHVGELGSPVAFEIDGGGGVTFQPFAQRIVRYSPDRGVEMVA